MTLIGKGRKLRTIDLLPFDGDGMFADRAGVGQRPIFTRGDDGKEYKSAAVRFHQIVENADRQAKVEGVDFRPL